MYWTWNRWRHVAIINYAGIPLSRQWRLIFHKQTASNLTPSPPPRHPSPTPLSVQYSKPIKQHSYETVTGSVSTILLFFPYLATSFLPFPPAYLYIAWRSNASATHEISWQLTVYCTHLFICFLSHLDNLRQYIRVLGEKDYRKRGGKCDNCRNYWS